MNNLTLALLASLGFLSLSLQASPFRYGKTEGIYFATSASVALPMKSSASAAATYDSGPLGLPPNTLSPTTEKAKLDYDAGFGFSVAGGYYWRSLRLELEYAYRRAGLPDEEVHLSLHTVTAHILYDFYLTRECFIFMGPGLGVGWGGWKTDTQALLNSLGAGGAAGASLSGVGITFGEGPYFVAQWRTGIGFYVTRDVALTLGYRLMYVNGGAELGVRASDVDVVGDSLTGKIDLKMPLIHSFDVGLRFDF